MAWVNDMFAPLPVLGKLGEVVPPESVIGKVDEDVSEEHM